MYEQTFRRLEKLKATFEQLRIDNEFLIKNRRKVADPLLQRIKELEDQLKNIIETTREREAARERILVALSEHKDL